MPLAKVNDVNMYYEVHGQGRTVTMIPGMGGDTSQFRRIIQTLSPHYQVVALDNRGAGQNDSPDVPYTVEMMADDVAGLLGVLGITESHVIGFSMGGTVAQQFVLKYPEKVLSLILGCTLCGGQHTVGWGDSVDTLNTVSPERLAALSPRQRAMSVISLLYTQDFMDRNPEIINELVQQRMNSSPNPVGQMRQAQAMPTHNTYDRLPGIKVPTPVIAGEEDKMIHPGNSRLLASRIPDAELVMIKNAGHGLSVIEETQTAILDFLNRNNQD